MAIYILRDQYLGHFGSNFCQFLGPNGPMCMQANLKLWFIVTTYVDKHVFKI